VNIDRRLKIIFILILHIFAALYIYYFFKQIGDWYLNKSPAIGVDLYNSATYVAYHLKHFSLPFNSFKDIWFGGYPFMLDFPQLSYYLMLPAAKLYGLLAGVQISALIFLLLFFYVCYLLFFRISRNWGLAILLSVLVALSVNEYGSLIWAGSLPYVASQLFFPLGLYFGVMYLDNPDRRSLALLILVTGIGILMHPLGIATFLIPSILIIIFVGGFIRGLPLLKIIKHLIIYTVGFFLAGFIFTQIIVLPLIFNRIVPSVVQTSNSGVAQGASQIDSAVAQFYKDQIPLLFTKTNSWIFVLLAVFFAMFVISLPFTKLNRKVLLVLPFILITAYTILHPALNFSGITNILRHDPYRAFWPFPIAIGTLVTFFWGNVNSLIYAKLYKADKSITRALYMLTVSLTSIIFIASAYYIFNQNKVQFISKLNSSSELSSAFPEALSISTKSEDIESLKKQVLPSFIHPNDKNKRLYSADAAFNIWWNAFFDTPLVRGYIDPPIGTVRRGGFFWLDIAIANDSIVRDFGISEEMALNNSKFLIDWYAVNYFQGGVLSSKGPSPGLSSYLVNNKVFDQEEEVVTHGAVLKWMTESGEPELHMELPQYMKYFKVSDKYSSEVMSATNAPAIIIFSSWQGYEDVLRALAAFNLNSQKIIPVYAGEFIDSVGYEQLKNFDAVIASGYSYKNNKKAFGLLERYVSDGGNLFIDTGGDVKESEKSNLPDVLPIKSSDYKRLGKNWQFETNSNEIIKNVDVSKFGELIYNGEDWKLSVPSVISDLRGNSIIILKHAGSPVLVERKLGKGVVIWSGINLFYHFNQYKSIEEAKVIENILNKFTTIAENKPVPSTVEWMSPERVRVTTTSTPRGILFKEEGYNGWKVRLSSGGKNLPIYLTGPTYPGFMYVPLPDNISGPVTLDFSFRGRMLHWFVALINILALTILIDIALFKKAFLIRGFHILSRKHIANISLWWEKENE